MFSETNIIEFILDWLYLKLLLFEESQLLKPPLIKMNENAHQYNISQKLSRTGESNVSQQNSLPVSLSQLDIDLIFFHSILVLNKFYAFLQV